MFKKSSFGSSQSRIYVGDYNRLDSSLMYSEDQTILTDRMGPEEHFNVKRKFKQNATVMEIGNLEKMLNLKVIKILN